MLCHCDLALVTVKVSLICIPHTIVRILPMPSSILFPGTGHENELLEFSYMPTLSVDLSFSYHSKELLVNQSFSKSPKREEYHLILQL